MLRSIWISLEPKQKPSFVGRNAQTFLEKITQLPQILHAEVLTDTITEDLNKMTFYCQTNEVNFTNLGNVVKQIFPHHMVNIQLLTKLSNLL